MLETTRRNGVRADLRLIGDLIAPNSRVLDIGCGNGELLQFLQETRGVDGRGIELSQKGVNECVARGLSVIQGDADRDLVHYPDNAFDYVILSQTLQATFRPREVLEQMMRIGRRAVVSFPNFAHWRIRGALLLRGRMPVTKALPHSWYDTPNIHFFTLRDFVDLCGELKVTIEQSVALDRRGEKIAFRGPWWFWNLFGAQAVFVLSQPSARRDSPSA
ncbi:MAG: methionine biosynthesis protein MetW [Bauldia sp.]|nr:methionine biosynthesis protein MetW [Bauldia sp.]